MILPDCHEVSRLLASGELDDASLWTKLRAAIHLAICRHCRRFCHQMKLMRAAARRWADGLVTGDRLEASEARLIARLSKPT